MVSANWPTLKGTQTTKYVISFRMLSNQVKERGMDVRPRVINQFPNVVLFLFFVSQTFWAVILLLYC